MVNHFSLFAEHAAVEGLDARRHLARGRLPRDHVRLQRQLPAAGLRRVLRRDQGHGSGSQRAQLRTYVHELGHAFNLLHSWQKNLADPPQPLGPNSGFGDLSWMNYA